MNAVIRLLLAESFPLVREGARTALKAVPDIVLVGEATNGDEAIEVIIRAIHSVAQGDQWFSSSVITKLADARSERPLVDALTPQEQRIFEMILQGWENTRIASELGIAEHTVRNHISHIYNKIGVASRFEILARTRENSRNTAQSEA